MRFPLFASALFAATSAACGGNGLLSPPPGLPHAAAAAACAPTDGPAVTVYLSASAISSPNPAPPNVQLSIWRSADQLTGTWSLAASRAQGAAVRIGPAGEFVDSAARGSITVLAVSADLTVVGHLDVTFASGTRIQGGFTAPWIVRTVVCG
ncbi:MAG: hypothetical protein OEW24_09185 [Chloroflexota bacterium]|nr:hypothetical protein [Chloroflexota bacterium]